MRRLEVEAEAEAAAQGEYEEQQAQYFNDLIRDGLYGLYAYETMIALLASPSFEKSGLSAMDYLVQCRNKHIEFLHGPIVQEPLPEWKPGFCCICRVNPVALGKAECEDCDVDLPF